MFTIKTRRSKKYSLASQLKGRRMYGANDFDALVPDLWAMETLRVMSQNMVAANLIHRNFENEIRAYGETVNTRKPNTFTAKRKLPTENLVAQDATATNIAVVLNQQAYTSFLIDDTSISKSFLDIAAIFAQPAALSLVTQIDRTILGQYPQFLGQSYGGLGQMTNSNAVDYLIGIRETAQDLLMPDDMNRQLILGSTAESKVLGSSLFQRANESANGGETQRTGHLGSRFGWNIYGCQNMPSVVNAIPTSAGAVNAAGGYAAGTKTLTVDGITGAIATGTYLTIAGDNTPQQVTAHSESTGDTTSITIAPGLKAAVANDAVITFVTPGAVNKSGGYAAGYVGDIIFDTTSSKMPKVGQMVSFGTDVTNKYTVLSVDSVASSFQVDRPLISSIANDLAICFGPGGGYNLAFHQNALALVNRPLALPMSGTGATAAVRDYNGISVRVTISYDAVAQAHRVTLDMLYGIAVLDSTLGAIMYS